MPLIQGKSKSAFSHNVGAERRAGKPQAQSVAIAYSEKAKAEHKKHLAQGGKVEGCGYCMGGYAEGGTAKSGSTLGSIIGYPQGPSLAMGGYADGGMMDDTGMDADQEAMLDECAKECMEAIKSGDSSGFRSALEALVSGMLDKNSQEDEE